MPKYSLLIVEDDEDDCDMLRDIYSEHASQFLLRCFNNATDALEYLTTTVERPFLIISDINMPGMDGLEFKKRLNAEMNSFMKIVPFVFLSTCSSEYVIEKSIKLNIQGYFVKPSTASEFKQVAESISTYWEKNQTMSWL